MSEVTKYSHLLRLQNACQAYTADHQRFPVDFRSVVEAGYLRETSRWFACPYVEDRLTTRPRHWSQSDFVITSRDGKPEIRLAPHVQMKGWRPADYDYFSIEIRKSPALSPDEKARLLEE